MGRVPITRWVHRLGTVEAAKQEEHSVRFGEIMMTIFFNVFPQNKKNSCAEYELNKL